MAKTPLDRFSDSVQKILDEYADDVNKNLDDITDQIGKKAAQAVRQGAKASVKGKEYSPGWTSKTERGRLWTTATVYNKAQPGLAHLLEYGHVIRNGTKRTFGSTSPRSHIEPVEKEIVEEYQKILEDRL